MNCKHCKRPTNGNRRYCCIACREKKLCAGCHKVYGWDGEMSKKAPRFDMCLACALALIDSLNERMAASRVMV